MAHGLLDRFVYWMFRLTILVTKPLPLRLGYRVAGKVASLCYRTIFRGHGSALRANLARVLATDEPAVLDAAAERTFRNFGKYVIDFIHFPTMSRDEIQQRLRFDQWDALNAAADSGRGVIIATLHFGNWDLGAAAMAAFGYPVHAIAETFRYEPMNALVQGSRSELGVKVIRGDRMGPNVFRALRRGEMLAMLVDVVSEEDGIRVDFFGAPALVSPAVARIALRTKAWVVPAVVLRGPDDDLDIRPIIDTSLRDFAPTGDERVDAAALTERILKALEPEIVRHPEQWFIFRHMWKES